MTEFFRFALLGLSNGGLYALLGLGLVLIYRGSGVVNFAHGGFALLGAFTAHELRVTHELPLVPALVATTALVGLVGVAVHILVMRPLRTASPLARVIASLGVLTILTQAVVLVYGPAQIFSPSPLPNEAVTISDIVVGRQAFYLIGIAVVVAVVLALVAGRTRWGHAISASAENGRAAAALGWSPDVLAATTWGLGGALAALAGALFPAVSSGFISVGQLGVVIIGALATALLAQFRSYLLALGAGLMIGVLQSLATYYTPQTGVPDSVPFLFIIAVLILRGRGLPLRGTITDRLPRVGTGRVRPWLVAGLLGVALVGLGVVDERWYPPVIISTTFAIMGLSIVVLTGYTGQLSIAQFALGGVGAFAAGRLVDAQGWPFELAVLAGVLTSTTVGVLFGLPALRTRGVNLAVVTFGLGFAVHQILFSNTSFTGGQFQTKPGALTFFGMDVNPVTNTGTYAMVCLSALFLCAVLVANLRRGRMGRRLLAVRTNERAAAAIGVDVFGSKLYAFAVSAAIAGLGGVLLGFSYSTILYQQLFIPAASITLLVLIVIGGVGYIAGPIIGSLLATGGVIALLTNDVLEQVLGIEVEKYLPIATGVGLLMILIINQHGMAERLEAALRVVTKRRTDPRNLVTEAADPKRTARTPTFVEPRTLVVRGLTQRFGGFTALDTVDLTVRPGEVVGLLGPNGAGKTTLIDGITGFNQVTDGTVLLDGHDITRWPPHRRARAGLTRSFQSLELFDDITVRENLLAASEPRDLTAMATDLIRPGRSRLSDTVVAAIDDLGLRDVLDERPEDLSYGRRRLVAIARAVASRPSIMLLDEPAAGLDEVESAELGVLIRRLADEWKIGVLLIEHDVAMVLRTADRVEVLDFGRTIAGGTPAEVRSDPAVQAAYLGTDPAC